MTGEYRFVRSSLRKMARAVALPGRSAVSPRGRTNSSGTAGCRTARRGAAGGTVLTAFARAFRTPDLRKKLLFTLGVMFLFRLGSHVPAPGVDSAAIRACVSGAGASSGRGLINLCSGGALLQLSVSALGIMPYITASIILQLLTLVIPRLDTLKKEGQAGQQKITQYTRYLTVGLSSFLSPVLSPPLKSSPPHFSPAARDKSST